MIKILVLILCFITCCDTRPFRGFLPRYDGFTETCHCLKGCSEDLSCLSGGCENGWSGKLCQREMIKREKLPNELPDEDEDDLNDGVQDRECLKIKSTDQRSIWKMKLQTGTETPVSVIEFQLPDTDEEALLDLEIFIGNDLCYRHDAETVLNENNTVSCLEALTGNDVTFSLPLTQSNLVNICLVKVYGCAGGTYGKQCEKSCNCWNPGDVCDSVTGWCDSGCADGFYSPDCEKPCEDGYHGYSCNRECGHCANGTCDSQTGACDDAGCLPNWTGSNCEYCVDDFYGPNCTFQCGHCLSDLCDVSSGECFDGCDPGFQGSTCHEECPSSTYGPGCSKTCGNCSAGEACDVITGVCSSGCMNGYNPPFCKQLNVIWSQTNIMILSVCLFSTFLLACATIVLILLRRKKKKQQGKTGRENNGFDDCTPKAEYDSDADGNDVIKNTDIAMADLKFYIDKRMAHDEFIIEFRKLPNGDHVKHLQANTRDNKSKNRFLSIYPYDHSRVKLPREDKDNSDYINANYINGYDKKNKYIATQGPMPSTIDDFWRMVWSENCGKIVMLTNVLENAKIKCHQYWPNEPDNVLTSRHIEIRVEKLLHRSNYVLREFKLKHTKSKEERTVLQFHYVTWPDHGVPSAPCLISFWKAVNRTPVSLKGPVIVHCSAGVGRTGTFLGLDVLVSEATDRERVDIFKCVSTLRGNRVNMIQTREQYVFLHYVVHEAFLAQKSLLVLNELEKGRKMRELLPAETIKQEFTNIELMRKPISMMKTQAGHDTQNLMKNRSSSIVPHDAHRVFLVTNVEKRNDYIMAYMVPSLYKRDGFISTQLPLESTVIDFWRMVYEYNSLTIVSLVDNISSDSKADVSYWPRNSNGKTEAGPFKIRYKDKVTGSSFYKHTVLEVEKTDGPDPSLRSTVHMFSVNNWSIETLVPDKTGMLHLIGAVRARQQQEGRHTIVVQDFDGASKCNVFCAVVNCLDRLKEDKVLDVFLAVREIMTIQPNSFQDAKEYGFCYEMIKEHLEIEFIKKNLG